MYQNVYVSTTKLINSYILNKLILIKKIDSSIGSAGSFYYYFILFQYIQSIYKIKSINNKDNKEKLYKHKSREEETVH